MAITISRNRRVIHFKGKMKVNTNTSNPMQSVRPLPVFGALPTAFWMSADLFRKKVFANAVTENMVL